jgi:outer membrane protein TolC
MYVHLAASVLALTTSLLVVPLPLAAETREPLTLPVERELSPEPLEPEEAAAPIRLATAVSRALEREARLEAGRALAAAADARVPQARALADPMLSYTHHVEGVQTRTGEQQFALGVSQRFPWPGKLSLRGDRASQNARAAQLDVGTLELDAERAVTVVFHRLAHRLAARQLTARERIVVRRIFDSAAAAYAAGDGTRAQMLKAQAELARLESKLAEHDGRIDELRAALGEWVGDPPPGRQWVPTQAPLPLVSLQDLDIYSLAKRRRPELRGLAHRQQAAALGTELARREVFPDISVGLSWIAIGDRPDAPAPPPPGEGDDAWGVTLTLNLPVYPSRRHAAEREALERRRALQQRERDLEQSILSATRGVRARLTALAEQLLLLEDTVIPLADESFAAARAAYAAGDGSFLDLLDAERSLLDARLERLRLGREYRIAIADLERTLGSRVAPESADATDPGGTDDAS